MAFVLIAKARCFEGASDTDLTGLEARLRSVVASGKT